MLYTISREQVAEIYVATFNRAPDLEGLVYWSNQSGLNTIEQIAESFFDQEETQAIYPPTLSNEELVNTIYNNVFNRDADSAGLAYWVDELSSGSISRGDMIIAIVNGAVNVPTGQDQRILDNKTEVGLYFAQNGKALTIDQAYEVMADVTSEGSSVSAAMDEIDYWVAIAPIPPTPIPPSSTIYLTTGIDSIEGSDIDSMIEGIIDTEIPENSTLNTGDIIDGGGGNDILKVLFTGGISTSTYIPHMTNVETLMIEACITGDCPLSDQELDLSGTTGLETIIVNSKANFTLTSTNDGSVSLIDGSTSSGELTILVGAVASGGAEIIGGSGNDTIDLTDAISKGTIEIIGGEGADKLTGSFVKDIFNYANTGDTGTIETEIANDGVITYTYSSMETADTISNFATGRDKISFEGLAPGNADIFAKGAEATSGFHDALKAADEDVGELHYNIDPETGDITDAFVTSTGVVYSYQYDGGKTGYLFMDSDNDGFVDQWIILAGLDANDFDSGDIA